MSTIARQILENKREITEFLEESNRRFEELSDPEGIPELAGISEALTANVSQFYSDSALEAQWLASDGISVSYPTPKVVVDNSGITTELSRVGHGLQRAALFSIVKFLAERPPVDDEVDQPAEFDEPASDIILLIEEPEIYQHPSKQIAIFDAFKEIAGQFNTRTGIRVQLIYTTHSEKFVRMTDFEIARIIRRRRIEDRFENSATGLKISDCSADIAGMLEPPRPPMSNDAFVAKLHIFTREVCEGFFADKVILTEGETDRAILEASYLSKGRNVHSESIAVIAPGGKSKLDKPGYIFRSLGIPTHIVFDNDANKAPEKQKPDLNKLIQKVCGVENPEDWPEVCVTTHTAIGGDLESYMRSRLGELYDTLFSQVATDYGLSVEEIKKTPAALSSVFVLSENHQIEYPLFDEIIAQVDAL